MAYPRNLEDRNPEETREWLDALDYVLENAGIDRANFLLERLSSRMTQTGSRLPYTITTPYRNTIPSSREAVMPGDLFMERRIRSLIRWNALAMVVRANAGGGDLGGHISSFASAATLYDVGFNYFFRGAANEQAGDLIYFQGHCAPGIYARSFLEGRLTEAQMDNFRREVDGQGLSSYPHPWLMPDYWQFPTVSMGLGPIQAIYQAHIMKYLDSRGLMEMGDRKVWAFLGDGECDEPESLGVLSLAGREKLDNLIFVVNCNLQRLDGPVRGNGKIIQELEGGFRGSGWNVIKVVWGRFWDPLLANDSHGLLQQRMNETVDGEYQ
ncbi:MAG: pyruvate dehydrogenase (acetyl-transferring), homodimeric type, partial [Gammaproteobacteria bacterium]|nr:pyruvate dehydrogenase (acetyl-transferring), homodimeric type [Gammaproteobacteria bacterium]